MTIFEAHTGLTTTDYISEADARHAVEAHGSGYIVKFIHDRSCAMSVFNGGAWDGVYIHGYDGADLGHAS